MLHKKGDSVATVYKGQVRIGEIVNSNSIEHTVALSVDGICFHIGRKDWELQYVVI